MQHVLVGFAAYVIGSVPFSYISAKLFRGIDIRRVGSRNVGTANVVLQAGLLPGVVAGLGDALKGAFAVHLARVTVPELPSAELVAILFAVVGHNWPVWLGFLGGGGVAPLAGGLALISLRHVLFLGVFWALAYLVTRHKYLSSCLACAAIPTYFVAVTASPDYFLFGLCTGAVIGVKQVRAWLRWARGCRPAKIS